MMKIKVGRPAIEFVETCYGIRLSPLLCGTHGIGKSEIFEQAAAKLGIDCITRDLSLMEPTDLVGLPKTNGKTTVYLPPDFLPRGGNGILLFEELNRCPPYMRSPCLQLLTQGTLNDYCLPDGWIAAAAINPDDAEYEVSSLDPALLSRFVEVRLVPDSDEWLAWAERAGVHAAVRDYIASDPSALEGPEANPRAWKRVSDGLQVLGTTEPVRGPLRAVIFGLVGDKRGAAFLRTLKQSDRPLTAEAILSSYPRHKRKFRDWITEGKLDLVEATLRSVMKHLQPKADYESVRSDKKRWANLARFLSDLPGDLHSDAEEFLKERKYKVPRIREQKNETRA